MPAEFSSRLLNGKHFDGSVVQHAGIFAFATTGAVLRMYHGYEKCMDTASAVHLDIKGYRLVNKRAGPVADIATQPKIIEAILVVQKNCKSHSGLIDYW
jgi:hypothetical protein